MPESALLEREEIDDFTLDVRVISDVPDSGPVACGTNDGCAGTCASSCASRS
jgi:FxLD family lantipeptide